MAPWWTDSMGGWVGGILGSVGGLMGGLIGTLAGIWAPRGKAERLVMALLAAGLVGGILLLAAGTVALAGGQPYGVWYPLVLCGGIATIVFASIRPGIRRTYRQAETRRLDAEELRRS